MFSIGRDPDDGGQGGQRHLAVDTGLAMLVLIVVGTAITANLGDDNEPSAFTAPTGGDLTDTDAASRYRAYPSTSCVTGVI